MKTQTPSMMGRSFTLKVEALGIVCQCPVGVKGIENGTESAGGDGNITEVTECLAAVW